MFTAAELVRINYARRLARGGIPLDPSKRTPDQQATAALEFWAAQNEAALDAATLTQAAAEVL